MRRAPRHERRSPPVTDRGDETNGRAEQTQVGTALNQGDVTFPLLRAAAAALQRGKKGYLDEQHLAL